MAYPAAPALHHNPLTVWRVENAAGEGPYDSEAATGVGPKGSAPVVDFGVRPEDTKKWWASHRGWRFGFAYKEDAVAWFGAARLKKLAEKGYRLVKKDAALIEPSTSDMQVFYLPVEKKLSGKENMLALGQGVTAEAEAEGWQRPYSRFMAAWAVADACRDDKDSWPYPKGLLSRYLKELAEFQRPGETWRQAWDRYAKPSWCKRRRVATYKRNPDELPVYHVGRLDQPRRMPAVSYEGSGLSVSLHPAEWRKIARGHVGGDTWELTKEDPKFLMATAANKKKAVDWAVANGWIAPQKRYRVSWFDDEMDDTMNIEFDSLEEAQEEADHYDVEPEEVDSFVLDKKGKAYWKQTFSSKPSNSFAKDFAIIWFAEANGYDGVWWNEKLDPARLSAPRGVIFQSKLPEWTKRKIDDARRNPAGGAPSGNRPIFAVKTNFPDADLWVIRKGTPEKIGSVAKTFSPEHIGVQVLATDLVLPDYLYYVLVNIHARGFYRERMTGTLRLQHITIDDVKDALRLLRL